MTQRSRAETASANGLDHRTGECREPIDLPAEADRRNQRAACRVIASADRGIPDAHLGGFNRVSVEGAASNTPSQAWSASQARSSTETPTLGLKPPASHPSRSHSAGLRQEHADDAVERRGRRSREEASVSRASVVRQGTSGLSRLIESLPTTSVRVRFRGPRHRSGTVVSEEKGH